jgi:hypothetical protein
MEAIRGTWRRGLGGGGRDSGNMDLQMDNDGGLGTTVQQVLANRVCSRFDGPCLIRLDGDVDTSPTYL